MQQLLQIARQGREMWGRVAMIEELLESCRSLIQARYSLQNLGPRQLSTNAETLRCVERQLAETGRELRRVSAQGGAAGGAERVGEGDGAEPGGDRLLGPARTGARRRPRTERFGAALF